MSVLPATPSPEALSCRKCNLALAAVSALSGLAGLAATGLMRPFPAVIPGILLLAGGALQIWEAWRVKGWKGTLWHGLMAVLYDAAGVYVLRHPDQASGLFAVLIAGVLLAMGLSRLFAALGTKKQKAPLSTLITGSGSFLCGVLLLARWPVSGLLAAGLFVSLDLLLRSWSLFGAARSAPARETAAG